MKSAGRAAQGGSVCLVQPPFVQLNAPYPSVYYLGSFLEKRGYIVTIRDHSIGLFLRIFSRSGLQRIFSDIRSRKAAAGKNSLAGIINRFLWEERLWLSCIDRLV
ncbi:MAG: hypothetical protein FWF22_06395, partial [Treponema sp.]|nr:hypothetical protein [Treponema sp.]